MDKQPKLTLKELARKALEKRKQKESEIIKTSETTQAQTPSEKAAQRKVNNKYINHVTNKLLTSLD
mgnify:CR=1 FL=1